MKKIILNVNGMSCEHCVKAIKTAVGALSGVESVAVDLDSKKVEVEYDDLKCTEDKIKLEIEEQGFEVV